MPSPICFGGILARLESAAENKQSRERTTPRLSSTTTTTTNLRAFTSLLTRYVLQAGPYCSLLTYSTPKVPVNCSLAPRFKHILARFPLNMDDSLVDSVFDDDASDFEVPVKAPAKAVVGNSLDFLFSHQLTPLET